MNRVIAVLFAGASLATAAPSFAADLPEPVPMAPIAPAMPEATAFDWTGAYVGGNIGYLWAENAGTVGGNTDGVTGGLFAGYNYEVAPNWIVGVEGDVNLADTGSFTTGGVAVNNDELWYGTLRGRVGYAFDAFMVYGTGGLAVASNTANFAGGSDSNTHLGYAVGAGLEAALTQNLTARAEYLYMDTGLESYGVGGTNFATDIDGHIVRTGLAYKF